MEGPNTNPGAAPQPGNEPNSTRYFPAGQQGAQHVAPPAAPQAPSAVAPTAAQYPSQPPVQAPAQATQPVQPIQPVQQPWPGYGAPPQYQQYPQYGATPAQQTGYTPNQVAGPGQAPHYVAAPPPYSPVGLPQMPQPPAQVDRHERDRTILGLILIGGGVLFLLSRFSSFGSFGDFVLLGLGAIFMYAYFNTKAGHRIGFLIPGSILLGLGVGQTLDHFGFDQFFGGDLSALTLGLGFCTIYFFERRHWWALIPGTILVLAGLSSMLYIGALWPLVLIGIGVYLLYGQSRRKV